MTQEHNPIAGAHPALVLVICLLAGGFAGFLVGQHGPIAAQVAVRTGIDPTLLSQVDEYIIAGFRCPSPACPQCELRNCECAESQGIRNRVKQDLGQGKDGSVIRQELLAQYGAQLQMGGQ
jgi:cytochrome c-type biogenesis protein CcmH/NrfF